MRLADKRSICLRCESDIWKRGPGAALEREPTDSGPGFESPVVVTDHHIAAQERFIAEQEIELEKRVQRILQGRRKTGWIGRHYREGDYWLLTSVAMLLTQFPTWDEFRLSDPYFLIASTLILAMLGSSLRQANGEHAQRLAADVDRSTEDDHARLRESRDYLHWLRAVRSPERIHRPGR